jgi:hypothetical protein
MGMWLFDGLAESLGRVVGMEDVAVRINVRLGRRLYCLGHPAELPPGRTSRDEAIMLFSWLGQADAAAALRSTKSGTNLNFEGEEHTCQGFESRDLVFRWTVLAQG